jgi:hypothetical protein
MADQMRQNLKVTLPCVWGKSEHDKGQRQSLKASLYILFKVHEVKKEGFQKVSSSLVYSNSLSNQNDGNHENDKIALIQMI